MRTGTLKTVANILGILGLVGGAASLGANIIHEVKPETANIPARHVHEIKKIVAETMAAEKAKKA